MSVRMIDKQLSISCNVTTANGTEIILVWSISYSHVHCNIGALAAISVSNEQYFAISNYSFRTLRQRYFVCISFLPSSLRPRIK